MSTYILVDVHLAAIVGDPQQIMHTQYVNSQFPARTIRIEYATFLLPQLVHRVGHQIHLVEGVFHDQVLIQHCDDRLGPSRSRTIRYGFGLVG